MMTPLASHPAILFVRARRPGRTLIALVLIASITTILCAVRISGTDNANDIPPYGFLYAPMLIPPVLVYELKSASNWLELRAIRPLLRYQLAYLLTLCALCICAALPSAPAAHRFGPQSSFGVTAPPSVLEFVLTTVENSVCVIALTLILLRWVPQTWAWAIPSLLALAATTAPVPGLSLLVNRGASGAHLSLSLALLAVGIAVQAFRPPNTLRQP